MKISVILFAAVLLCANAATNVAQQQTPAPTDPPALIIPVQLAPTPTVTIAKPGASTWAPSTSISTEGSKAPTPSPTTEEGTEAPTPAPSVVEDTPAPRKEASL
ncbi:hypothetical protein PC129_g17540 [Phytophthora cactorum]|uniref:RxLR effector protein n=1 Tax=Phytophthora cactorum TaxID=29920 RepID=A0A8T1HGN5_9STRA|nr:hypothetical protein PC129_g17540 [Phytophthora cactorum]